VISTSRINSVAQQVRSQWPHYARLMRLDKPIGILLLLWPTLWSLWLAAKGVPDFKSLFIFVVGVVLMRSAGCVINDYADRHFDAHVERTRQRPLVQKRVSEREALVLFGVLCALSFVLVLFTNTLTIWLSLGGAALAAVYPFMKRYTYFPQLVLGAAFSWGIIMAFTAVRGELTQQIWLIYIANVIWTLAYDTFYAMVDRRDDIKIGVKSTAVLFGDADRAITASLQGFFLFTLLLAAKRFELGTPFYLALIAAAALCGYQQWLIKYREPQNCFKAFLNNNYVGLVIFLGIAFHYGI
jgi:4-hydroxybenzoate polyprenyltransferase